ncbi:MAG TPA: peptidylprolyl isomerase [Anaerolineae bacterium]|nr:peptidylprolyl isomerase [Anaerolineae bacterium]
MRTRLSIFCDKVIEAGWLAAIIVVPLFFNIYSQRVFEPDKISLLRSLVLVMACAWLVRILEDWRGGAGPFAGLAPGGEEGTREGLWKRLVSRPLALPILLFVLVYILSTILSVSPSVSFLGSYQRLQGTYTTLSYIVLFALVLDGLRTKRQLDRLVSAAILSSFPVALYGLVQHFGLDPLPWGGDVTNRVASNMGNAIFVAAYLIMVLPLTLVRLLKNWKETTGPVDTRDGLWGVGAFLVLAACLLVAMLVRQGMTSGWIVWAALALGLGLQVPVYVLNAPERRVRILAISLPLTFAFLVAFSWLQEIIIPPPEGVDVPGHMWLGILAALIFAAAMVAFAYYLRKPVARLLLLSTYFTVLIAQLICIFYTQSRGPLLGLLAGLFVFVAALGIVKRKVGLTWAVTALFVAVAALLVVFNTADTPLIEKLRETRYIGRLGKVLQTEEGTGKVRVLIWEGVIDMVAPHDPLVTPGTGGGPDKVNALRPFVGYGPESMYVAYNRFYPADLAHYEKRNASPDRSHNETFDALAQTGIVGFLVYMFVFASVFYLALRYLGLIRTRWQRWLFLGLWTGGGIAGALVSWLAGGEVYLGVGIPGGVIILGVGGYLLVTAALASFTGGFREPAEGGRALWVIALLAAFTAHFVEIHFGIAIASTRTYFWVYAALLVALGTRLAGELARDPLAPASEALLQPAKLQPAVKAPAPVARSQAAKGKKPVPAKPAAKRRQSLPRYHSLRADDWWGTLVLWILIAILILGTMLFDYITVQDSAGAWATIWRSLTQKDGEASPIMLVLLLVVWATIGLVGLADLATQERQGGGAATRWLAGAGVYASASPVGVLLLGLLHAVRIRPVTLTSTDAANPLPNTITYYYVVMLLTVLAIAAALTFLFRRPSKPWHWSGRPADAVLLGCCAALPVLAVALLVVSNLGIVRADILYKQGLTSEKAGEWEGAVYFYQKAIDVAPDQDYYYLFLGRALMEKARAAGTEDPNAWFLQSEVALQAAREIAPLNTDHSANLGRLYRTWGGLSDEPKRAQMLTQALAYYADATTLSPQNVQLLNEYGQTYLALGDREAALAKFQDSLRLDKKYTQTYLLLGEYYLDASQWAEAVKAYQGALGVSSRSTEALSSLGYAYSQQGLMDEALAAYERAVELSPRNFGYRKNLAIMYQQMGRLGDALREAEEALALAPDSQAASMESYVAQLRTQNPNLSTEDAAAVQRLIEQGKALMEDEEWDAAIELLLKAVDLDPGNVPAHSALAYAYAKVDQVAEAIAENLAVLERLPGDYSSNKNLALLYQRQGETEEAVAYARAALSEAPEEDRSALEAFLEELGAGPEASPTPVPGGPVRAGDLAPAERNNMYKSYPEMTIDPEKSYHATIVTAKGNIVLELYADKAPLAVNSFVFLARQGFFDHTTFHRVLSGFMAQGGDPQGTGTGGPGYQFANETDDGLRFDGPGVLGMANAGPDTNGSQFFITYAAASWLDGGYTIFGHLTAGMDVLQSLTPRDPSKRPSFVGDEILTIEIEEK